MNAEGLKEYRNLVIDYSLIRELGGTPAFSKLLDVIVSCGHDVYVSKTFKLFHYCVIHQADSKHAGAGDAMKSFCSLLLTSHKLHSVQACETSDFIKEISSIEDCCILCTEKSIFVKRLLEKRPSLDMDIWVYSDGEFDVYKSVNDLFANMPVEVISPLASLDKYLDAPVFCNVGDVVMTGEQRVLRLTQRVSSGAEGMVFLTDDPKIVAKIYHKGVITPLRWSKLTKMVSMGIKSIGICWPRDLLFYKGIPVGYTMIIGKGKTLGNIFDGPDAITNNFPKWQRADVVNTLIELLEKYIYLHMHNIIAGDIQLKNALIYTAGSIYLIDMDSVQVDNMPCPVGTEDFTAPDLWGKNFSGFLRTLRDEDYSIAMLVFSVLFCGLHPYATRNGKETLREEILERNFPYSLTFDDEEHIPRGGYNFIWIYLTPRLREMLYGAFKEGRRYEAVEWYDAVIEYKDELESRKYEDPESYKVFPKMDYKVTEILEEEKPARPKGKLSLSEALSRSNAQQSPFAPIANSNTNTNNSNNDSGGGLLGLFKKN